MEKEAETLLNLGKKSNFVKVKLKNLTLCIQYNQTYQALVA